MHFFVLKRGCTFLPRVNCITIRSHGIHPRFGTRPLSKIFLRATAVTAKKEAGCNLMQSALTGWKRRLRRCYEKRAGRSGGTLLIKHYIPYPYLRRGWKVLLKRKRKGLLRSNRNGEVLLFFHLKRTAAPGRTGRQSPKVQLRTSAIRTSPKRSAASLAATVSPDVLIVMVPSLPSGARRSSAASLALTVSA